MSASSTLFNLVTPRKPGLKRLGRGVVMVLVVLLCTGALMELLLRSFHQHLPAPVSNFIATSYHAGFDGIYDYSPRLHMRLMRPNTSRQMVFNGYRWLHQTDEMGFRNPSQMSRAEVVLLGDSMIYGHGVEQTGTVSHHLNQLLKRSVANLGIQGGSAHQEYQLLRNSALKLSPRTIVLFFLTNDIRDLWDDLTGDQMRRFIKQTSSAAGVATDPEAEIRYFDSTPRPLWRRFISPFEGLHAARASYAATRLVWRALVPEADAALTSWSAEPLFQQDRSLRLAMAFHLKALKRMRDIATSRSISFLNVFIYTGQAHYAAEEPVYQRVLRRFCLEQGILYLDLRQAFETSKLSREELFLKNDGHFTSEGARLAAETVAHFIQERGL